MTTQAELDADMLAVLNQHLATRRELLKRVRVQLAGLQTEEGLDGHAVIRRTEALRLLDAFIAEAAMPTTKE